MKIAAKWILVNNDRDYRNGDYWLMMRTLRAYPRFFSPALRKAVLISCLTLFMPQVAVSGSARAATITTFDAPEAGMGAQQGTYPQSVNLAGAITGWYTDLRFVNHGFVGPGPRLCPPLVRRTL